MNRLLVVSNGYGEDVEVAQVIRAMPSGAVDVLAYPLVGLGHAYPADVTLLDPRREFPSGGFGARVGPMALWDDIRRGWLGFWRAQRRTLKSQRGRVALTVAAGDVYCLWMAALVGGPIVYLALPRSEYVGPHSPPELWIIRRAAAHVFTRDEVTAEALRRRGIPAEYRGFPLMDTLVLTGESFEIPPARPALTLLPGSKPAAFDNLLLLLRAAELASAGDGNRPAVLVAWPPNLSRDRLRQTVETAGGRWVDAGRFHWRGIDVLVVGDHFADVLARATVVLGMAGAAHEQAAGLGKPVVAFPGTGPQFTARFLREQQRLLGDALVVARTPEEGAAAASALLRDPVERERRGRVGRDRQGPPGGAAAIAQYLLERLSA
ncbi:MAG TPA: lipid-A-disaccharide synthase-related protein [bacterium]|nr:lipid-A-disaccharide synthase-related protein [bacterium]